jgi:hypothetical protein
MHEMVGVDVVRLWKYGGPNYKGTKPMKVTFKSSETVDKFIKGAKEAGFLGSRTVVDKGKYQGAKSVDELPVKFYIRPSTTMEERRIIAERQQKRSEHEKSDDYARWLEVKTREKEFTHNKVGDNVNDLNEAWFLKPEEYPTIVEGGGSGADIQNNEQVKNLASGKDLPQKASKRGRTESPPKADKPPTSPNPEVQEENKTDPPMDLAANEDRA